MLYVEDLIHRLAGQGKYLFDAPLMPQAGWEWNFVTSVSNQIDRGNALTEKQATMCIRVLKKYKTELEKALLQPVNVETPQFRNPFRIIREERTISIGDVNGRKSIIVNFPYDADVIKSINIYVKETNWKSVQWNTALTQYVANWEHDLKFWRFALIEENVLWLQVNLVSKGFIPSEEFVELAKSVQDVVNNVSEYAPMVVKEEGYYKYQNCHDAIVPIDTSNVIKFLFDAKNQGITTWNDKVDRDYKSVVTSQVTKSVLDTTNAIWVDSTEYKPDDFADLIKYGGPALIIIPGGSEIQHTVLWHQMALEFGIQNKEMSVMFRTPNQDGGEFNKYIREHDLNNPPNENTKIVFVSTKIPKPLIKSGICFNTVLNLGFYHQLHFSMSVLLQSTTNVVYYTNKQPHGVDVGHS